MKLEMTKEQENRLIFIVNEYNRPEAAKILKQEGLISTVRGIYDVVEELRHKGLLRDKSKQTWSESQMSELKSLAEKGLQIYELAEHFNKCNETIRKKLKEIFNGTIPFFELEGEEWKNVEGSIYKISNYGRLRCNGNKLANGTIENNRVMVTIRYKDGTRRKTGLHRLVAEAFIPNPESKETVDHIDSNPLNNKVSNLRWATKEEQNQNTESIRKRIEGAQKTRVRKLVVEKLNEIFALGVDKLELISIIVNNL